MFGNPFRSKLPDSVKTDAFGSPTVQGVDIEDIFFSLGLQQEGLSFSLKGAKLVISGAVTKEEIDATVKTLSEIMGKPAGKPSIEEGALNAQILHELRKSDPNATLTNPRFELRLSFSFTDDIMSALNYHAERINYHRNGKAPGSINSDRTDTPPIPAAQHGIIQAAPLQLAKGTAIG